MPDMQLIHYLRKGKTSETIGVPIGLLLGTKLGSGIVKVSWSFCHRKDSFTKRTARIKATARTFFPEGMDRRNIPHPILKAMPAFIERCARYFRVPKEKIKVVDYLSKEVST